MALAPRPGRTPWWVRLAGLTYSHVVLVVSDHVWSQPIKGVGRCVTLEQYEWEIGPDREYLLIDLECDDYDPTEWLEAIDTIAERRSQKIRTVLRMLRLWPKPAWNCTSPVRIMLGVLGIRLTGETPDAIVQELTGLTAHD